MSDPLIYVDRHAEGFSLSAFRLSRCSNPHWGRVPYRILSRRAKPGIFVYVRCNEAEFGHVEHDCRRGPTPCELTVCVLKESNDATVYQFLKSLADKDKARNSNILANLRKQHEAECAAEREAEDRERLKSAK